MNKQRHRTVGKPAKHIRVYLNGRDVTETCAQYSVQRGMVMLRGIVDNYNVQYGRVMTIGEISRTSFSKFGF